MTSRLVPSSYKYFWDTKPEDINPRMNAVYTTERLLELGDINDLKWLEETYGKNFIKKVVTTTKKLSRKSANFYALYFGINPNKILCLQEDFYRKHRAIWKH